MTIKYDKPRLTINDLKTGDLFRIGVLCIWMLCEDTPNEGLDRKTAVNISTGRIDYLLKDMTVEPVNAELVVR